VAMRHRSSLQGSLTKPNSSTSSTSLDNLDKLARQGHNVTVEKSTPIQASLYTARESSAMPKSIGQTILTATCAFNKP